MSVNKAVQVDFLMSGIVDASGLPYAGGLVYTYEPGTVTPKAMYTVADKSVAATNPIVLDSRGKALVFADGGYKVIVKTAAGTTLYTWDNLEYGRPVLRVPEQSAAPSLEANAGYIYTKDDGAGNTILYFKDHAGTERVLSGTVAAGDVTALSISGDNELVKYHLATGKIIQRTVGTTLTDAGGLLGVDLVGLDERASHPTFAANIGQIYTKEVDGKTELYYRNSESGDAAVQITSGEGLSQSASLACWLHLYMLAQQTVVGTAEDVIQLKKLSEGGSSGAWNDTTYLFTAPSAGKYLIMLNIGFATYPDCSYSTPSALKVFKDNVEFQTLWTNVWGSANASKTSVVMNMCLDLAASATIQFKLDNNDNNSFIIDNAQYTNAFITKIGT